MKTPLLAWLAAASLAFAATTNGTTNKKPSGPTPPGGNKAAATEKEKAAKKPGKTEPTAAAPEAPADPLSLVAQTVDATTQMALDAAKAAQAEADKLAAIGSGKAAAGPSNAKLAEAAVVTGAAVAKELSKPKKETDEAKPEPKAEPKPEAKKPEPKSEKKPAGEKPKKAAGA